MTSVLPKICYMCTAAISIIYVGGVQSTVNNTCIHHGNAANFVMFSLISLKLNAPYFVYRAVGLL